MFSNFVSFIRFTWGFTRLNGFTILTYRSVSEKYSRILFISSFWELQFPGSMWCISAEKYCRQLKFFNVGKYDLQLFSTLCSLASFSARLLLWYLTFGPVLTGVHGKPKFRGTLRHHFQQPPPSQWPKSGKILDTLETQMLLYHHLLIIWFLLPRILKFFFGTSFQDVHCTVALSHLCELVSLGLLENVKVWKTYVR